MALSREDISDLFIPINIRPTLTRVTGEDDLTFPNTLRVWRSSPSAITLQIRRMRDFIGVNINETDARQLREALDQYIAELVGFRTRDEGGA